MSRRNPAREREILEAAHAELLERGYRGATMIGVAQRASASKETLYAWYGNKEGLFGAMIEANAAEINRDLDAALQERDGAEATPLVLRRFAEALLRLLTGDRSVALNRIAIAEAVANPSLAELLMTHGRRNTLPRLAAFVSRRVENGEFQIADVPAALECFVAILLGDWQQQRLLGRIPVPSASAIKRRAATAVENFYQLYEAPTAEVEPPPPLERH